MFDINLFITAEIEQDLEQKIEIADKVDMLIKLINYENEFPEYAEEISNLYYLNTSERYDSSEYFITEDDKEFILEYASATGNFDKTKVLLNDILSSYKGEMNYDEVIANAQNEISPITNIEDYEFSSKKIQVSESQSKRSYKGFIYPK